MIPFLQVQKCKSYGSCQFRMSKGNKNRRYYIESFRVDGAKVVFRKGSERGEIFHSRVV